MNIRIPVRARWVAAGLAFLLLTGCANVYSPVPMGTESVSIDAADWDGLWTEPGVGFVVKTLDEEQGVLDVLMIDGSTTQSVTVQLLSANGWLFASFNDYEDEDAETEEAEQDNGTPIRDARPYAWVRVVRQEDKLVFWQPHTDRFRRAVERGDLPGKVAVEEDGDPVYLGHLEAEHYRLITESTKGVLMDWEDPIVLARVTKPPPGD